MKSLFILLIMLISIPSQAGGWSSAGGELLKESRNPWYLNNVEKVYYCLLIDEQNFGADLDSARKQLQKALEFWRNEFQEALLPDLSEFGQLKIATQNFVETSCQDKPSLKFQFGILNQQQKIYLDNSGQFAAVSVRTNYDKKTLTSQGFVYVAPEKGPLIDSSMKLAEGVWSKSEGHLLFLTLVHELGHIFGIQHMGTYGDIMSEGFVELVTTSQDELSYTNAKELHFFSLRKSTQVICPADLILGQWQRYFEVGKSQRCFKFVFLHDLKNALFGETTLQVFTSMAEDKPLKRHVETKLSMYKFFPKFTSIIWLPKEQNVFSSHDLKDKIGSGILGINGLSVAKKGRFLPKNSKYERVISVKFDQGGSFISIDGVFNGNLIPLL